MSLPVYPLAPEHANMIILLALNIDVFRFLGRLVVLLGFNRNQNRYETSTGPHRSPLEQLTELLSICMSNIVRNIVNDSTLRVATT